MGPNLAGGAIVARELKLLDADEIFNDALDLPRQERTDFVWRACEGNPALVQQIARMLDIADPPDPVEPVSASPTPSRIGKYDIVSECGRGGMAVVYEAVDVTLGRRVALKKLPHDLASPEALQRLKQEARLLASIDDERIARLHSLEEDDGLLFLTMEYVQGRSLAQVLAEGPLPSARAIQVGIQICLALETAHAKKIVHRDLKPSNIMCLSDGRIKILDFGISKVLGDALDPENIHPSTSATLTSLFGTPRYMSPEQLAMRPIDHRVDLWALGCVLFECLAGEAALDGTEQVGAAGSGGATISRRTILDRLPSSTPRGLRNLVIALLQPDPDRRPASCHEVRRALESLHEAGVRRRRLNRWGLVAMMAAALVAGSVALRDALRSPARVELFDAHTIRGTDTEGRVIWTTRLPDPVIGSKEPVTVHFEHGKPRHAVVFTRPEASAISGGRERNTDSAWLIDARSGDTLWSRPLSWTPPLNAQRDAPQRRWHALQEWPDAAAPVIAIGMTDGVWYPIAIQFLNLAGDAIGMYYHPGRLYPGHLAELADGRRGLILYGDNSSARFVRDVVPFETRGHCGAVVLLDSLGMDGQAWPYSRGLPEERDWPGMPEGRERSYLLIPPLSPRAGADVTAISAEREASGGTVIEAWVTDGRMFRLDEELVPRSCYVTMPSLADSLLSGSADSTTVFLFRRGERRELRVPLDF